jgi:predicted transcriptional regulator
LDKIQVADRFHLVKNIHQAIKDALSLEVAHDLFVREGDGWIRMVDSAYEEPVFNAADQTDNDCLVVVKPATLVVEDIESRIHLAGLNKVQANKYKKTLEILELTESGLRTQEIAKMLSIKNSDVRNYRKNAPKTIENVELKIDEHFKMRERGQCEYHQKTIAKNPRPSSQSIVEPYKETVLRMFNEGKNHRSIHPVIVQEGFRGSANAVYQYLGSSALSDITR